MVWGEHLNDSPPPQRIIPITRPFFGIEEQEAVIKPLLSGWVVQGPYVKEFEGKFSKYIETNYSVATTSCTTALHMAVVAMGLAPGDEVIVPAFTWVSTANVVEYMGAKPIFCDVSIKTYNINTELIEEKITPKTVGIIPVHLFGLCADMDPIMALAEKYGLWVIEDAACGLGATYDGQHSGTFGDMGCFSFHPRKSITVGEGGMITTDSEEISNRLESLRDHGASKTDLRRHSENQSYLLSEYSMLGYNYRMTDMQGAIGSVQMDRLDFILSERRAQADKYNQAFHHLDSISPPFVPNGLEHGYQAYVTLYKGGEPYLEDVATLHGKRNELMKKLENDGISTRQGTHAAALTSYYSQKYSITKDDFPNSYIAEQLTLSLPVFAGMSASDQDYVIHRFMLHLGS